MKVRNRTIGTTLATASRAALATLLALALSATGLEAGLAQAVAATSASGSSNLTGLAAARARADSRRGIVKAKPKAKPKKKKRVTKRRVPKGWRAAKVSWYGPGLYGNGMAGGGKLRRTSMVVAHKRLPFGTMVEFWYKGRTITVPVRDRGPFVAGREFDLGPGPAHFLRFSGVGVVQYRIVKKHKKHKKPKKLARVRPVDPTEAAAIQ